MSDGHPSPIWRGAGGEVIKWKGFTFSKGETFCATVVFPEGFGEKWKPICYSPIPVPSPNWRRVQKFRGSWIEFKKMLRLILNNKKRRNLHN